MRFLLVDDDKRITELLKHFLAPFAECVAVNAAVDAIEAFRLALSSGGRFDAVFMDIMMPGMDGHRVVEKLRNMEREAGAPQTDIFKLVMVSAHSDIKNVCKSFFSGQADAYVTKPIEKARLIEELRKNRILPAE